MNEQNSKTSSNDLSLFDQLLVSARLKNKLDQQEQFIDPSNLEISNQIINKIINFCDEQMLSLSRTIDWNRRENVIKFFNDLNRLRHTLMQTIALTGRQEDFSNQAHRFLEVIKKFLTLYILSLEEAETHVSDLDSKSQTPIIFESEIEEYKMILEDDMMQDISSTNHLILELLKKDSTSHPKLKEILLDY